MQNNEDSILLVEEDRVDVLNIVRAFNANNMTYPIHTAESPAQALELLRSDQWGPQNSRPNIILLSLSTNRRTAHHFLRIVRGDPSFSDIDIFVLASSEQEADIVEAYKYHVQAYIVRPNGQEQLRQVIYNLGNMWKMSRRPRAHCLMNYQDDSTRSQTILDI